MNKREYFPMNAAGLLDRVFYLYKKSFWMQILMSIMIGIITSVIVFILTFAGVFAVVVSVMSRSQMLMIIVSAIFIFLLLIIVFITSAASSAGNIYLAKQAFYGEKIDLSKALSDTIKSVPRVSTAIFAQFLLYLPLTVLLAAGLFGIFYGLLGIRNMYSLAYFVPDTAVIVILVIFAVLSIFLTYLCSNFFAVTIPVSLFERRFFFKPLIKSWRLIKADFWVILGIRFIFFIVLNIISFTVTSLFNSGLDFAGALSDFTASPADIVRLYSSLGGQYVVASIISAVLQPLSGILTAVFYFNQKIKKEGLDIEIGLDRLAASYGKI